MGRASTYGEWEDVGLAFTDEEVASWTPEAWVDQRIDHLGRLVLVLDRRAGLPDVSKPQWSAKAREVLKQKANWYARCRGEGIDWSFLSEFDARSKGGKEITAEAVALEPSVWVDEEEADAIVDLRCFVTMCRRAKLVRAQVKLGNRLANALQNEANAYAHLRKELAASPKGKADGPELDTVSGSSPSDSAIARPT